MDGYETRANSAQRAREQSQRTIELVNRQYRFLILDMLAEIKDKADIRLSVPDQPHTKFLDRLRAIETQL